MNWKNNRPDGWKELLRKHGIHHDDAFGGVRAEAGADAMYEALMKYRVKMPPDFAPTLLVIPSEEIE